MTTTTGLVKRMLTVALDLVFPLQCAGCGRVGAQLCPVCRAELDKQHPIALQIPYLDEAYAAGPFEGVWRRVIHAFKYEGERTLAETLAAFLPIPGSATSDSLAIAVPLHPNRQRWRGYNQAGLLAQAFARHAGLHTANAALIRHRDTRPQVGLSAAQRRRNVQGAFRARPAQVSGQSVILVDDVLTTGATLSAGAAALREAGARSVSAVTLACAV